ncbi:MAG: phytanoyl-CoA dioxygenase family protein, partial [Rhodospirillales bacterium]|nr:phytanoyl-CoA dioxygenase family protein [Rhodospirillales bacterium]
MLRTPVITDDQLAAFERDGYLVVRGGFSAAEMALIMRWTDELAAMPEVSGRHWVFHEKSLKGDGRDLISRIENIAPFHDGFAELAEALRAPVGRLLGEEAALFKEKVNFKMPGGDGFKPHKDSQAGWDAYADFFI